MKKILKDYFSFNSRERVSILFLCCLITFFWVLPNWYPTPKKMPVAKAWKEAPLDSEKIWVIATPMPNDKAPAILPTVLFEFNPNELPAEGWKKLGIRDKTVQTILNYREKGGRFREPADLKKIWGLTSAEANKLIPYVRISNLRKQVLKSPTEQPSLMPATILINQVSASELLLIPGFNKSLAARMIKFRDKMGGFKSLDQVRKTYGLSDSLYHSIAPLIEF
jgi:DNA uptake protein ComE-like DNA-binding protein